MAIDAYKDPLIINWYTDNSGNKVSLQKTNQSYIVVNGQISSI
jgi:hypothetical protein